MTPGDNLLTQQSDPNLHERDKEANSFSLKPRHPHLVYNENADRHIYECVMSVLDKTCRNKPEVSKIKACPVLEFKASVSNIWSKSVKLLL